MAVADVFDTLTAHWADTVRYLTAEDIGLIREAARLTRAAAEGTGDEREANTAVLRLTLLLPGRLPAAHPVNAAIANATRLAGPGSGMGRVATSLGAIVTLLAAAQVIPGDGPPPPDAADEADETVEYLLAAQTLTSQQARDLGVDPGIPGLIRLVPPDGRQRLPAFQFDQAGHPIPVVMTINRLLDADDDPFGVADWWLGRNAWLGDVPADLIGSVEDALLIRAARAEFPGE